MSLATTFALGYIQGYPIVEVGYSEAELPYMIIALNIHICVMIGG